MPTACVGRRATAFSERRTPVMQARRRGPRPGTRIVVFLAAVLLSLCAFGWLADEKTVMLQLDGRIRQISTRVDTVGQLLERTGIAVRPMDRLVPGPSVDLVDGMVVEFVSAREVTVLMDGQERTILVPALRAEDVVDYVGVPGEAGVQLLSPAPLSRVYDGMVIEVGRSIAVTVVADGRTRQLTVPEGMTVAALLQRLDLRLDDDDRVDPSPKQVLTVDSQVVVNRVEKAVEAREVPVPAPVTERTTDELPAGARRELRPGRDGILHVFEEITWVDGVEARRTRTGARVVDAPEPRVVAVGTGRDDEEPAPSAESASESTQGVDSQDSSDRDASRSQSGTASWYDYGDEFTAAHRTLPKGTLVTVTNLANGKSVQVRINDRGPFIDGRVIDLNRPAFAEIASVSEGVIRVRISW